jgi:hypothetical protein
METASLWITQVADTSRAVAYTIVEIELIAYTLYVSEPQDMQPKSPSVSPIQERNAVF